MNAYNLAIALSVMGHLECEEMSDSKTNREKVAELLEKLAEFQSYRAGSLSDDDYTSVSLAMHFLRLAYIEKED